MKYRMKNPFVDAARYESGMEDGWVVGGRFYSKDVPAPKDMDRKPAIFCNADGSVRYITITKHDYIVTHADGTREVIDRDKFDELFEPAGEPQ